MIILLTIPFPAQMPGKNADAWEIWLNDEIDKWMYSTFYW